MKYIWIVTVFILGVIETVDAQALKEDAFKLPKYHVESAPEWTNLLKRNSGWFGGDGIFSISMDGNESSCNTKSQKLVYFSDTFVGEVKDGVPEKDYKMVNNSIALVSGCEANPETFKFMINKNQDGSPATFFVPKNANATKGQYYWLGDGFVNKEMNDSLFIFAYHVEMTGPNVFDFKEPNVSLLAIPGGSNPPFTNHKQHITPLHIEHPEWGQVNFGAGILVNTEWAGAQNPDGYIYVYGCMDKDKKLVAGRTLPSSFSDFSKWQFWDGKDWQSDALKMQAITNGVSNELSVTPLPDGRFLLVFQVMGISEKVGARVGLSPVGPFGDIIELYRTPEIDEGLLPYNAKAHPVLSKPGELLISYNTITFDFWNDIAKNAHIYRPRFIRIIWE
ncbi:MAG: hypothetical protein IPI60_00260 [Saprospiraceae bacterium]|nr:hypothetical protein [Saprospiraceae bacterium]